LKFHQRSKPRAAARQRFISFCRSLVF
jgi:hypothetical protein